MVATHEDEAEADKRREDTLPCKLKIILNYTFFRKFKTSILFDYRRSKSQTKCETIL